MTEPMPIDIRSKLKRLRTRCKTGYLPDEGEIKFLSEAWKKWPCEYVEIGREVLIDTWPAGGRPTPDFADTTGGNDG